MESILDIPGLPRSRDSLSLTSHDPGPQPIVWTSCSITDHFIKQTPLLCTFRYYVQCINICESSHPHYSDVIMGAIVSQITSLTIVYSLVYSDADQRRHQSSASLAFVRGIHWDRWIPRTNGQLRGKCFHLMMSSCASCCQVYRYFTPFYSFWTNVDIWRHATWSTLVQVLACCLTAPSHYLNQCWLVSEILGNSPEDNFTENAQDIYSWSVICVWKLPI